MRKLVITAILTTLAATIIACGGGGSTTPSIPGNNTIAGPAANVAPIVVSAGPAGISPPAVNSPFTSVTVCIHGTSSCQTIDNILVDTGSIGLRLLSSTGGGELTLALPQETDSSGNGISECSEFVDNVSYGSVRVADIQITGETASNVPIQVIGDLSSVPASCTNTGLPVEDILQDPANPVLGLYANGILGVGPFPQDCGLGCLESVTNNPTIYYSCPSSGCQDTVLSSISQEVVNPVVLFPKDNNGVIVELPAISGTGQNNVAGSLVFGIGTQSNNGLGGATVFPIDPSYGLFTTIYNNIGYLGFIDSGSSGLFFLDQPTIGLVVCPNGIYYCSNANGISVANQGSSGSPTQVIGDVNVADADTLGNFTAFNNLAGPNPGMWDWGLPFFFGRNVYTSIEGQAVPGGVAPYFAY